MLLPDEEQRLAGAPRPNIVLRPERKPPSLSSIVLRPERLTDDVRANSTVRSVMDTNPDKAGATNRLAGEAQLPDSVVARNFEEVAKEEQLKKIRAQMAGNPVLARQLTDPTFAGVAYDQTDNLSAISASLKLVKSDQFVTNAEFSKLVVDVQKRNPSFDWDTARRVAGTMAQVYDGAGMRASQPPDTNLTTLMQGLKTALTEGAFERPRQGLRRWVGDVAGQAEMATDAARKAQQSRDREFLQTPQPEGFAGEVFTGVRGTVQNIPALAAAVFGAPAALSTMAVQGALGKYDEVRTRGGSVKESSALAAITGGLEAVTEIPAMGYMIKSFGRVGMGEFLAKTLAKDLPLELVNTIANTAVDTAIANPNKTWGQWAAELPAELRQTVISTFVQAGILSGAGAGVRRLGLRSQEAVHTEKVNELMGGLFKLTEANAVRERAPTLLKDFIRDANTDGPVQDLYIDSAVLTKSLEQAGITPEQAAQLLPSLAEQFKNGPDAGDSYRISFAEALTFAPGTGLEKVLLQHGRTHEDGMSAEEAKTHIQTHAEQFKAVTEQAVLESGNADALTASTKAVQQTMVEQLTQANRFSPDVNKRNATLVSEIFTVLGAKAGLTPEQMYAKYPLLVRAARPTAKGRVLESKSLITQIKEALVGTPTLTPEGIAAHTAANKAGTFDLKTNQELGGTKGYAVSAHLDRQQIIKGSPSAQHVTDYIAANNDLLSQPGKMLGTWFNEGSTYLDVSRVVPTLEEAFTIGRAAKQLKVMNLETLEEIDVPELAQGGRFPQTETPEFKEWFGESKVLDAQGKPLQVYHGTVQDVAEFALDKSGSHTLHGATKNIFEAIAKNVFFFTSKPEVAESFAVVSYGREYINLRNEIAFNKLGDLVAGKWRTAITDAGVVKVPIQQYEDDVEVLNALAKINQKRKIEYDAERAKRGHTRDFITPGANIIPVYLSIQNPLIVDTVESAVDNRTAKWGYVLLAKALGRDGVIFKNMADGMGMFLSGSDVYVPFKPTQIKSSVGNRGTFSATDPNILAQEQLVQGPNPAEDRARQRYELNSGRELYQPDGTEGTAGLGDAQAAADAFSKGSQKLIGLPDAPLLIDGQWYVPGPSAQAHSAAQEYMAGSGMRYDPPRTYVRVDAVRAALIAAEYEKMKHDPTDPEVALAYQALREETLAQWQAIKATGLKVEFIDFEKTGDPYAESPRLAIADMQDNNHLWVFPTDAGFGTPKVKFSTDVSAADFRAAVLGVNQNSTFGAAVHVYSEAEYADMRLFMDRESGVGFALKGDDIVSVFSSGKVKGVTGDVMARAVAEGGRKLDVFDTELPRLYAPYGFRVVSRMPWDEQYRPEGWDEKVFGKYNNGRPDVVFMEYDPTFDANNNHPSLAMTDEYIDGKQLRLNDVFRIVHDYFGHIKDGVGFRAEGEENAWRSHAAMFSPLARRAMTTSTRGQNSWVNYGPHGAANRKANAADTIYAPQKAGLLPQWVTDDGRMDTPEQDRDPNFPSYGVPTPGSISVLSVHFSMGNRELLSSAMYGTGALGAERADVLAGKDDRIKERIFFYTPEGNGIIAERKVGGVAHGARLNNIYDATNDPLGIWAKGGEAAVVDAGFDGYYARDTNKLTGQGVTILLNTHNVPVTRLGFERDANAILKGQPGTKTLRQDEEETPPFYSQLTRLLEGAKMNTAPAGQWISFIKGLANKGVKKEEIEVSGVLDWLELMQAGGADPRTSKQDVMGYLAENGTKVETVLLGGTKSRGIDIVESEDSASLEDNGPSETEIQTRANALWDADADRRYESSLENARESDYVQYEVKLLTPTFRIVQLPPDTLREGMRYGVQRVSYDTEGVDDVADLGEPTLGWWTDEDFLSLREALAWTRQGIPFDERRDANDTEPSFVGIFKEAGLETADYDTREEAESAAVKEQDQLVERDAEDNYEEFDDHYLSVAEDELIAEMRGRGEQGASRVRHTGWQSEGGRGYREMILSVPNIKPYNADDDTHFGTDTGGKTVAWARFKLHEDSRGITTMFVEEIQSQRAQHGKDEGFSTGEDFRAQTDATYAARQKVIEPFGSLKELKLAALDDNPKPEAVTALAAHAELLRQELEIEARERAEEGKPPVAPFVKDTQAWTALVLKRLLRYAVDNDIKQVAWTTGAENAVRYGTKSSIDSLKWTKVEGGIQVEAVKDGKIVVNKKLEAGTELGRTVGKRIALRITDNPNQTGEIPSSDLDSINGLGMQTFYGDAKGLDPHGKPAIVPLVADKLSKTLGGEGVKTIDLTVREKGESFNGAAGFIITPEMAAKIKGGLPLFQDSKGKARGTLTFANDITSAPSVITLLENANLSTFLHETGHFFLEVMTHMAAQPDAPAGVVKDVAALMKWFGVSDLATWRSMTLDEQRDSHERFARGFEAYLMEGKSSNPELNGLFATFSAWLKRVYKQLTDLNVELTDEVRGVFDRMIASEAAIREAEAIRGYAPLFASAKEMGATEEEWIAYQQAAAGATEQAVRALQEKSLRNMGWLSRLHGRTVAALSKDANEKRKAVRNEVQDEVRQDPVYAVQQFMKHGMLPDGTQAVGAKMSIPALREMYGEGPAAPWRYFNTGKFGLVTSDVDGGMHPDAIAEMFGFSSGDEMVRAILAATPESAAIDGMTDQRMLERYSNMADPQAIEAAANAAIHNDMRMRVVAMELNALTKAVGPARLVAKAARDFADALVAAKKIRDLRPGQYTAAEARSAKNAMDAVKKSDTVLAATEKRNQLVNGYAAKATTNALKEVEKGVEYLRKFDREGGRKSLDVGYLDQIDKLLERFEFRNVSLREIDKRETLAQWLEQQRDDGFEPDVPQELQNEAARTNYKNLTVEQFRGLLDTIRQIEHLARLKKKLLTAKDHREFDVICTEITSSIEKHAEGKEAKLRRQNTLLDHVGNFVNKWLAMHRKVASLARELDGFKDGGPMWEFFTRSMNAAGDREAVMREQATMNLFEIVKPILSGGKMGGKGLYFDSVGQSFNREERIAMALNVGNDGNKQRLLGGEGWIEAQIAPILATLTKADWVFVQSVWDFFEGYRPDIGAKEKRVYGKEPKWVEATPVSTPFGTFRGGYYPVKFDSRRSGRAEQHADAEEAKGMMRAAYTSATTRRSFTKTRAEEVTGRPLQYSFAGIYQGANEVIHDLSWHEWLIDVNRLMRSSSIDTAIRNHYGPETVQAFKNAIKDIALGDTPATNAFETAINHLRQGATIAGLGWNVVTSLLQPIGLTQSMVRIGPLWVAKGIGSWAFDSESSQAKIYDKSDFMRLRAKTMQREIAELRNVVNGNKLTALEGSYFYLIQKMQQVADIPTWLGQYEKQINAGNPEDRAVALADSAVLDAQGGGQQKDLAQIQRGGPLMKLFTNFYSFFNTTYNLTVERTNATDFKSPLSVGLLAVDYLLLFIVPATLGAVLKMMLKGTADDDDEEIIRKIAAENLSYLMGTMVGVRELGGVASAVTGTKGFDYAGPAGLRFFGEMTKLSQQAAQGEADKAFWRALNSSGGVLLHYPSGAVQRFVEGAIDMQENGNRNPGVLLLGPPKQGR